MRICISCKFCMFPVHLACYSYDWLLAPGLHTLSATVLCIITCLWYSMIIFRSQKKVVKKVVGKSTLTFDELVTTVAEIEATLNNRPLTYVQDDEEGVSYVLTPASLIYGQRLATTPSGCQFEVLSTNKTLTKRAKHQFRVPSSFTRQWQKDYLLSLQERRAIKTPDDNARRIQVGDIVILKEDGTAKCLWKLAKVTETLEG